MEPCLIRPATSNDAAAAIRVMRASITELCTADHQNDPTTLDRWLWNKTPEQFVRWLDAPDVYAVVAEVETALCGVGLIRSSGDLDLCYVQPGKQRSGVGGSILNALEAQSAKWGLTEIRLISTATARAFYERHGYVLTSHASVAGYGLLVDYNYVKRVS